VSQQIVVSQPRRIAARLAAHRVASELGEPVGGRYGYQVRFESKVSAATRIVFVTEGLLLRRLRDDPTLGGVGVVILDELHERHVHTDVALALVRHLQRTTRPDLRIIAMSATLDAAPVAAFLDARTIDCPGRTFPVEVEYVERASDRSVGTQVAAGLRQLSEGGLDGGVLVFLPGGREIREAASACAGLAAELGLDVAPLHGELSAAAQDDAVSLGKRPKLVLSTNLAETSVTIDDIAAVIDTGLVRRPAHDPWSGMPTLTLAKISRASATQRAGRAGRTRPGRCLRLFPRHEHDRRPEFDTPEITRLDLASSLLDLRALGLRHAGDLVWLTEPPQAAVEAADALLRRLGAIEPDGSLTATGRRMLRFPTHPRLARLLVEGERRGCAKLAARVAAALAERSVRRRDAPRRQASAAADVLADLDDLDHDRAAVDRRTAQAVERSTRQLVALVDTRTPPSADPRDDVCIALLHAFPDRVARVEAPGPHGSRVVFASGGDGELDGGSVVAGADLIVAVSVDQRDDRSGRGRRTLVRSAAQVEPEWLLELPGEGLVEHIVTQFDAKAERVDAFVETRWDRLVIERAPCRDLPPEASAALAEAAASRPIRTFVDDPASVDQLLARAAFVRSQRPETVALEERDLRDVLTQMCDGARSFAQLRRANLVATAIARMPPEDAAALRRLAPEFASLPGGRRLAVHYELDRPPWVQSRLQDFFGSTTGPTLADGRSPLVLHLLAPNQRAVQVTTDLAGFWERHYPALRKQLMRRYPKHAWPEDPRTASPPAPRPGRPRRK
jgi:ATP-dependent helicase HrpB